MANAKENDSRSADIIKNWIRNRYTPEFLGTWEQMNNPNFKPLEFEGFRKQAGLNSFVLTPMVVLSNLESINTILIYHGLAQSQR